MTATRNYKDEDNSSQYEDDNYFFISDDDSYRELKSNQETIKAYEVELTVQNNSNDDLINVSWGTDRTNHIAVSANIQPEDSYRVDSSKNNQINVIVITDESNLTSEQIKELLIENGLKLTCRADSQPNTDIEIYFQ